MKYTRTRDYLSRHARDMRARDMRNPYGSRGGYVVSDKRGYSSADRNSDREYYTGSHDMRYYGQDYAQNSRNSEFDREYSRDNGNYGYDMTYNRNQGYDMTYYPVRRSGYFNYNTYGGDMASNDYKLTPTEIRKWDRELKNEGAPFSVDQVRQVAQQHGIRFDEFTPELLTAVANMMYTDYKDTVKGDISMFVKLAKDFLCDDDFDGEPEEKAYLYYTAIVNKDDD